MGTEELFGDDLLVSRVKRRPPTWLVEKYLPGGEKVGLMLIKAEKGTRKAYGWTLTGKGYLSVHGSRNSALRAAEALQPVLEADCLHCGQVIDPGTEYCDTVCQERGPSGKAPIRL